MEKKFKRGDVVRLKSGSPEMTVDSYVISHDLVNGLLRRQMKESKETENVRCFWLEENTTHKREFHQDMLTLVGPPQP